jgi:cytosine/adenosine deaminase-related metal-dependent hydrolase
MDVYRAVRLALLDAMASGITTLNHCTHDIGGEHAETAIVAHIDSGMRGRLSYPVSGALTAGSDELEEVRRLEQIWFASYGEHLLDLGIAIDGATDGAFTASTALPIMADHACEITQQTTLAERTIGPAKTLEIDHCIGSLSPGKRADIVLIAAGPHDATPQRGHDIVCNATTPDVLMVAIDGRLRKQNGVLVEPNEGLIRREGCEAIARLRAEARWPPITN